MTEDGELTDIEHIDLEEFDGMNDAQIEERLRRRALAMKAEVLSNFLYGVAATGDEEHEDMIFDYLTRRRAAIQRMRTLRGELDSSLAQLLGETSHA
jgi:hypothetical protein